MKMGSLKPIVVSRKHGMFGIERANDGKHFLTFVYDSRPGSPHVPIRMLSDVQDLIFQ